MDCPIDGATLVMTERQGVEIDYCPRCRGVWLDRGELDKILERSASYDDDRDDDRPRHDERTRHEPRREEDHSSSYARGPSHQAPYHKKKKKNLFSELFEGLGD
ncbi:MAG TPA: zf-TFIIB domain-containing protein [Actinomycetota bacterium]|nr:zf-TFIIB domain-containing protein [Actinomycetota bacterium]